MGSVADTGEETRSISEADVEQLFRAFVSFSSANTLTRCFNDELLEVHATCKELCSRDYNVAVVSNKDGELCSTYPADLLVLEGHKGPLSDRVNDARCLGEMFCNSRHSRVRGRFVMPVMLVRGKNICRSSTLSHEAEVLLQRGLALSKNYLYGGAAAANGEEEAGSVLGQQRAMDIKLLKELAILHVCDLMVEERKQKFGMYVCSSEKVDTYDRYTRANLKLTSIPYPGVEFFRELQGEPTRAHELLFNWDREEVTARLRLPDRTGPINSIAAWDNYKDWSLVQLTENYLSLISAHVADPEKATGVLVHCISGWDRTPLFISLLRLSLWADGEVHESLSAKEMLYFTVAYDWMLFSHHLSARTARGELVFLFCFYFLEVLKDRKFSVFKPDTDNSSALVPRLPMDTFIGTPRVDPQLCALCGALSKSDNVDVTAKPAEGPKDDYDDQIVGEMDGFASSAPRLEASSSDHALSDMLADAARTPQEAEFRVGSWVMLENGSFSSRDGDLRHRSTSLSSPSTSPAMRGWGSPVPGHTLRLCPHGLHAWMPNNRPEIAVSQQEANPVSQAPPASHTNHGSVSPPPLLSSSPMSLLADALGTTPPRATAGPAPGPPVTTPPSAAPSPPIDVAVRGGERSGASQAVSIPSRSPEISGDAKKETPPDDTEKEAARRRAERLDEVRELFMRLYDRSVASLVYPRPENASWWEDWWGTDAPKA